MNNIREKNYGYAQTRERDFSEFEETTARNEFANEPLYRNANQAHDFDSLLDFNSAQGIAEGVIPAPKAQNVDEADDLMPSIKTMKFRTQQETVQTEQVYENATKNQVFYSNDFESEADGDRQYRINTKGKILIAVYALVVLTIFALIIINTRLLKNLNTSVSDYETQIKALKEQSVELKENLELVSEDEEILRKAKELGMGER